jgi:hypothetical protein
MRSSSMEPLSLFLEHGGYSAVLLTVVLGSIGLPLPEETILSPSSGGRRPRRPRSWSRSRTLHPPEIAIEIVLVAALVGALFVLLVRAKRAHR